MRAHADARPPWTPAGQSTGCGGLPPTRGSASKPPAGVWDDGRHGRTGIRTRRRHRRVRHAGRRRQGQGAQGRRPAGHRLRRRGTRLPHPRLHRRGRRRRGPRPQEPPLHAGRRHAGAARGDRRQDRPRHAVRGRGRAGAGHQRRQAGRLQRLRHPVRPGRRGPAHRAVLDDLPRGDQARRRRPGRGRHRRDLRLPGHRRAARGRPHRPDEGAAVRLAVQPDGRGLPPRPRSRPSARGRASTTCGSSPTRSTSTWSTATPRWCRSCTAPPPTRSSFSTGSPRPTP